MTKAAVIASIAKQTGVNRADVQLTIESFFKVVKKSIKDGENVYFRGFGSFIRKRRAQKVARNITKNTAMIIKAHDIPAFKPSKRFISEVKKTSK